MIFMFVRGMHWGDGVYDWTNLSIVAVGFWALADKQSVDAVFMVC